MSQKAGKKTNKQTVAAQRARHEREEFERQQAKSGKRKRDAKEIAVIIISVIVACSLMLPSLAQIFAQPQTQTIPTTAEDYVERYQPLVDQYQADLNADPEDAEAELNLANTYFEWGSYARMFAGDDELKDQVTDVFTKAYDAYGKYIEMQGDLEDASTQSASASQALCQFYLGNSAGAVDQLTELAEKQNYAPAWANLGMVYASMGNDDAAIEAYQKGIEADPDDANGTKSYCEQQIESLKQSQEAAADDGSTADDSDSSDADATSTTGDAS